MSPLRGSPAAGLPHGAFSPDPEHPPSAVCCFKCNWDTWCSGMPGYTPAGLTSPRSRADGGCADLERYGRTRIHGRQKSALCLPQAAAASKCRYAT